jgi:hypothetical protein
MKTAINVAMNKGHPITADKYMIGLGSDLLSAGRAPAFPLFVCGR